jgi:purine-nucleoside phosphorylase
MSLPTPDLLSDPFGVAQQAAAQVAALTGAEHHDVAVVLGSGWRAAADRLGQVVAEVPVTDLVGFPPPSVAGHVGALRSVVSTSARPRRILVFLGRVHLYEGHEPATVAHAVRTAVMAGCRIVVLTNAAGGINREYAVGQPVLIADHINLTGRSPLAGPTPPAPWDVRFVDMTDAYSARLRAAARAVDPSLVEGVYAAFPGPQYETPAEIRMAQRLGADLAGMSTVLETIAARHLGAAVLGCSLVTNMAAGIESGGIHHEDVLAVGRHSAEDMGALLAEMIARL